MPFSQLPYELVVHISTLLHIPDLLNLAVTCAHVHTCLGEQLKVHQHKLATLSSVNDLNRSHTMSALRMIFQPDHPSHGDIWYFREVTVHAYSSVLFRRMNIDVNMPNPRLSNEAPFNTTRAISDMSLLSPADLRRYDTLLRRVDRSEGFEGFLTLALLQMPRLSRLRFALHPCNGHDQVCWRFVENAVALEPARVQVFGLLLALLSCFEKRIIGESSETFILPAGLRSLQSIEIEIDQLHNFNNFGEYGTLHPELHTDSFRPLFLLPNLKRLLVSRHPLARRHDSTFVAYSKGRDEAWRHLYRTSPVEELVIVGFGSCGQTIQLMTRSVRQLRALVLQQRGNEHQIKELLSILQLEHAPWLETFIPPSHTSNALSWCQSFSQLRYLTLSYIEVMEVLQEHCHQISISDGKSHILADFHLATRIPESVEMVVFIGGLISGAVPSLSSHPFCCSTRDIQHFTDIVAAFVSTRGSTRQSSDAGQTSRNLRDLCFGDMRVVYKPENAEEGVRLHSSSIEDTEIGRHKLGKALHESEKLKEMCSLHRVRLHFTDLTTRVCDHAGQHPYLPKKRLTRQELIAEAERLSEDADVITKTVLSRYVDAIPADYWP